MVGTTHPAMLELVLNTFGAYGRSMVYPMTCPTGYAWRLACDLPEGFAFLTRNPLEILRAGVSGDVFYAAVSGFGDAEGHVGLGECRGKTRARFSVSNRNYQILSAFENGLISRRIPSSIGCTLRGGLPYYTLAVSGENAVALLPYLSFRHPEKSEAKQIVMDNHDRPWDAVESVYRAFRTKIRKQRDDFVSLAKEAYRIWPLRKAQRKELLNDRRDLAIRMRKTNQTIARIEKQLDCSERTVYRYLSHTKTP